MNIARRMDNLYGNTLISLYTLKQVKENILNLLECGEVDKGLRDELEKNLKLIKKTLEDFK